MKLEETEWSKFMIMAPWAKIYKKQYLIDNDIEFLSVNLGEDIYFNLKAMLISDKIKIIPYIGYNWFFNTSPICAFRSSPNISIVLPIKAPSFSIHLLVVSL